jgi:TPR repeat protein
MRLIGKHRIPSIQQKIFPHESFSAAADYMNRIRHFNKWNSVLVFVTAFFLVGCGENQPAASSSSDAPERKTKFVPSAGIVIPDTAYAVLKDAEAGDASAQLKLGLMYDSGEGVPKDTAKANEWLQKAAAQGNANAQYFLGVGYLSGEGMPKDAAKAFEWLQKAAAQEHTFAQNNLGLMYYNGEGASKDATKAVDMWQKAAAQDDALAQYRLGEMYANGIGVAKDAVKAVEWYQKAAAQGNVFAQGKLGAMYANGTGVPRDNVLGYAWSNLAAAGGDEMAGKNRAMNERSLSAKDLAEGQRISSAWKPGQLLVRENSSTETGDTPAAITGIPSSNE